MLKLRFVLALSVSLLGPHADGALGQNYPGKPIRIVTGEPGGGSDIVTRLIGQGLTGSLGQQVIVDNRGGSAVIPFEIVSKAPADGYTLLVAGGPLWILPFLQTVSYNPLKDFAPITVGSTSPLVVVVNPSLPIKSIKDLIAAAKGRPGELNYASGISGTGTHLAAELFKSMAGVNMVRVAYKGGAPAVNATVSGETQLMFAAGSNVVAPLSAGKLRALAVTSAQPSALFPALPTVASLGLPGYEVAALNCLFAPANTPAAVISRLNQETVRFLSQSQIKERMLSVGVEAAPSSPENLATFMKSDMAKLGKVIKDAGIRGE